MPKYQNFQEEILYKIKQLEHRLCCKTQFYATVEDFPAEGEDKVIYVDESTGSFYIWNGTGYVSADSGSEAELTGSGLTGQIAYWDTGSPSYDLTGSNNLFWDNANGRLGVNNANPLFSLDINGLSRFNNTTFISPVSNIDTYIPYSTLNIVNNGAASFTIDRFSTNVIAPHMNLRKSRGLTTAPTSIQTGDELGFIGFWGHDGTSFQRNAIILASASSVSGGLITPVLRFGLGTSAGSTFYRLRIESNGDIVTGDFTPSARLHVRGSGNTSATTALLVQNSTPTELFKVLDNGSTSLGLSQTFTTGNLQYSHLNVNGDFTVNTLSNSSSVGAISTQLNIDGSTSLGNARLINAIFNNRNTATNNIIRAGYFSSRTSSSGAGNTFIGLTGEVNLEGSGNVTNASAIEAGISKINTSIITNVYGVKINNLINTGGTITNTYGVYIGDMTTGTQTNTPYAIYSEDASAVSYIAGNTAIGTTTTSGGRLTVRGSGTTSATTALLVQNSTPSTLFEVKDNGAWNFNGAGVITGNLTVSSGTFYYFNQYTSSGDFFISASGTTNVLFTNGASNNFGRLQLGGTTASYPSIKRSSNNIEIKNANDTFGAGLSVGASLDASAILQADSTTKGFLPPRMTTTERNAITTPAAGLVIFNTTTTKLECYDGAVWQAAW